MAAFPYLSERLADISKARSLPTYGQDAYEHLEGSKWLEEDIHRVAGLVRNAKDSGIPHILWMPPGRCYLIFAVNMKELPREVARHMIQAEQVERTNCRFPQVQGKFQMLVDWMGKARLLGQNYLASCYLEDETDVVMGEALVPINMEGW